MSDDVFGKLMAILFALLAGGHLTLRRGKADYILGIIFLGCAVWWQF